MDDKELNGNKTSNVNKKKKWIIRFILFMIIGSLTSYLFILYQSKLETNHLRLINRTIKMEYGDEFIAPTSENLDEYLDLSILSDAEINDIKSKITIDTSELKFNKMLNLNNGINIVDQNYLQLGTYKITFTYNKSVENTEKVILTIKVVDTIYPIFDTQKISELNLQTEINQKFDLVQLKEDFFNKEYATDIGLIDIIFDESNIDYNKPGEYKLLVKAIDSGKNETETEIVVKVIDKSITENNVENHNNSLNNTSNTNNLEDTSNNQNQNVTPPSNNNQTVSPDIPETSDPEEIVPEVPEEPEPAPEPQSWLNYGVLDQINAKRAEVGVAPLSWDSALNNGVMVRAKEQLEKQGHVRPDGTIFKTAMPDGYPRGGEIITNGSNPVNAWMNSTGHRESMLASHYTHCAIATCNGWTVCILVGYY